MIRRNFIHAIALICSLGVLMACGGREPVAQEKTTEIEPETAMEKSLVADEGFELFATPSPALQRQIRLILDHYLNLKENLVESSAEGASKAAEVLLASLESMETDQAPDEQVRFYHKRTNKMAKLVRFIADNKMLEEQRVHFSAITTQMYELLKAFNANEEPVFYQYCPMAFHNNGGYWLSSSKEILNPYFGEKMLKCGQVTETIRK